MAFKCDNCGKGLSWGHRVSHAKNRTNHAFRPNIQRKRIMVDGRMVRAKLCANCIKTLRKVKKVKTPKEAPIVTAPAA
ncbi:MAG: 50S ribosomal protein L28 [Candidatus Levybacteria bacterium RIFCSPHIGHO2_01_FULL_40_10]|nr:MAG: 50S ribosomal protein L28 [Candidatus Levybacteria bacterium RIFCSPHIGHO2_01_FULL_40_10]